MDTSARFLATLSGGSNPLVWSSSRQGQLSLGVGTQKRRALANQSQTMAFPGSMIAARAAQFVGNPAYQVEKAPYPDLPGHLAGRKPAHSDGIPPALLPTSWGLCCGWKRAVVAYFICRSSLCRRLFLKYEDKPQMTPRAKLGLSHGRSSPRSAPCARMPRDFYGRRGAGHVHPGGFC